jgi:N-acetylglucosaminyldiphosphoundecaprenol N-acetyl-beta-D-mannosaminyltransferase
MGKLRLLNTYINNITMDETVACIDRWIESSQKAYVTSVNVDILVKMEKDLYLNKIINQADLTLADGKPVLWISNIYHRSLKEKISGSDLVPRLCELAAKKKYRIFILGGQEGVAETARKKLEISYRGVDVNTYAPPYGFEKKQEELDKINNIITQAHPDLLITCLGCPKQEKWIYENISKYDAKVSVVAGATVDFLAGNVQRAPRWMSNHGLEWFYRFLQEPRRLFKRYFIDDMKILKLIWKYRNNSSLGTGK